MIIRWRASPAGNAASSSRRPTPRPAASGQHEELRQLPRVAATHGTGIADDRSVLLRQPGQVAGLPEMLVDRPPALVPGDDLLGRVRCVRPGVAHALQERCQRAPEHGVQRVGIRRPDGPELDAGGSAHAARIRWKPRPTSGRGARPRPAGAGRRRREARVVEALVEHLHDVQADVEADEVGQLERAHRVVQADPGAGVDVLGRAQPFLVGAHRLAQERHQHAVDDEARPVAD